MPDELETFTTTNNCTVTLRTVHKGDAPLLVDMFYRLSPETKRLRFHLYTLKISAEQVRREAEKLADLDPALQVAVVALHTEADGQPHAVGVARFARKTPAAAEAEVAVVVRDDFQRERVGQASAADAGRQGAANGHHPFFGLGYGRKRAVDEANSGA